MCLVAAVKTHIYIFILKTDKVIVSLSWLLISVLRHIITYLALFQKKAQAVKQ